MALPGDDELPPIPGTGDLAIGLQMDGGVQELVPDEGGVKEDDKNTQKVGGGAAGIWLIF